MTVYAVLKTNPLMIAQFDTYFIRLHTEYTEIINCDNFDRVIFGPKSFLQNFLINRKKLYTKQSDVIKEAIKVVFNCAYPNIRKNI